MGLGPRSNSQPAVSSSSSSSNGGGSMKHFRKNSRSFSGYGGRGGLSGSGAGAGFGAGAGAGGLSWGRQLRLAAFYVTVFVSGCVLTAWVLGGSEGDAQLGQRSAAARLLQHQQQPLGARRGLYTAGTGGIAGSWDASRQPVGAGALQPSKPAGGAAGAAGAPPAEGAAAGAAAASAPGNQQQQQQKGQQKQQQHGGGGAPGAPADFDWRSYLVRYPDLRASGIRTREAAAQHYAARGAAERRSYARIPVLLRYTACQGLFNQMYAHLNALVLADHLGADVMLPPSVFRESFAKYFTMDDPKKNQVRWTPADVGALLDVEALQAHYAAKGMRIHRTAKYDSFPDCMHPQDAFPRYAPTPELQPDQVARLDDTYLQSMHIWYVWDRAAEKVLEKHQALVAAGRDPASTVVVLDLPCPFLSVMTLTCMESAQEAATALKFNRTLVGAARTVINGMRAAGVARYNGAHLRLEKDAVDWARVLGGLEKYLQAYARAFGAAGFSRRKDLYIASGLLSYNASKEMSDMLKFLEPHARSVQYKERYLPAEFLRSLNPEQEALVDFLVLANADNFVGLGSSTFSVYLREYRVLLGHMRLADVFVDTSRIGTDALFERTTHFAQLDTSRPVPWQKPSLL